MFRLISRKYRPLQGPALRQSWGGLRGDTTGLFRGGYRRESGQLKEVGFGTSEGRDHRPATNFRIADGTGQG